MLNRERIEKILASCEGVTPGPWYRESVENEADEKFTSCQLCSDGGVIADTLNSDISELVEEQDLTEDGIFYDLVDVIAVKNIDHLENCDPDTIRSLCELALEADRMREAISNINNTATDNISLGRPIQEIAAIARTVLQPEDTQ